MPLCHCLHSVDYSYKYTGLCVAFFFRDNVNPNYNNSFCKVVSRQVVIIGPSRAVKSLP